MKELIENALTGGMKELAGLELSGTIPIKQELINDALQAALETASDSGGAGETQGAAAPKPKIDGKAFLPHVKRARIDANNGKLTLTFEIKIDA